MDLTSEFGLLVIGSGPAGVHAATAYLDAGGPRTVCVVSADRHPPYQRPPLSKDVLAGREPVTITPILDDDPAVGGVELRLATRVAVLDTVRRVARTDDGEQLSYDRLVVATGSSPVPLPGADPDANVFTLRSFADARRIIDGLRDSRTAVVVGSGFIGCEAAASIAARGLRTILVTPESGPQVARLGSWAGDRIAGWLRSAGVELRTEVQVEGIEPPARVRLDDGSFIDGDLVLAAVGVTQSRGFLEASRLEVDDGRVVVDEQLQASEARVWAAGDVAKARHGVVGRLLAVEHWGDAITMGRLAGRNAAADVADPAPDHGKPGSWTEPPGFWSEIGNHTLKYSAWGDGYEEATVVEHGNGGFAVWYADADDELVGVLTHDRDRDYERGVELLSRRAGVAEALGPAGSAGPHLRR
jgi:3-phenylpropionate/trans-cinnamate dioxygenase ferredoxin reductase component